MNMMWDKGGYNNRGLNIKHNRERRNTNNYLKRKLGPHTTNRAWLVSHQHGNRHVTQNATACMQCTKAQSMQRRSRGVGCMKV